MLDLFSTDQQNLQSPANGQIARVAAPSMGEAFAATKENNDRLDGYASKFANQHDYLAQRTADFTARTGQSVPQIQFDPTPGQGGAGYDQAYGSWLDATRATMQAVATERNDPTLAPPTDQDIAAGGLALARSAVKRQAELSSGPMTPGSILGGTAAGAYQSATDPLNVISLAAAPEGGALLASALKMGGAMAAQTAVGDIMRFGYRQQVNPDYGVGDVAGDVAGAFAGGALFGAGHALGGEGLRATLGAAAGGAIGGGALGAIQGGGAGALQGAIGGAALPLAGAGFGLSSKALGMSWRVLRQTNPELAASMPLDVRDAGTVAEKAGDVQAQSPFKGPNADAAHADAVGKIEGDLIAGRAPELPPSAQIEAAARRGQVFYPGGAIDARYDLAEHADLVTSHDADFNVRPDYPAELQPRDRSGAPAQDQVNSIAGDLQPDRLGPSPEANSGAPIVGPDGVVESGNGRALAIGRAYDLGRGEPYRQALEQMGYDTSGYDKPVLVGVRETPMDAGQRADFAHAANGSASLRMSATEQALSDARHLDPGTVDLAKSSDMAAASNRDFARAFVAKLPAGERGAMMTRDGALSANGVRRAQAAMAARAYGDPGVLSRAFDHPDPNIKAIAGALTDAAGPWARMRDAATRGDIAGGHDITADMVQAVKAVMRARDEGRPPWEVLNQGDMFQSDTTQLAARMFFRDDEMRQPAGRARVAEALTSYANEARKNTIGGRMFADDLAPVDVLRRAASATAAKVAGLLDTGAQDVLAMARRSVPDLFGDGKTRMTAPQLDRAIADRQSEIDAMKRDPARISYPGRLEGFQDYVTQLEEARKLFEPGNEPRSLFKPAKIIDAGNGKVVSIATDERHGAHPDVKTFRIFAKPDGEAMRQSDLGPALGHVDVRRGADGRWEVQMVEVRPSARGQGVATALYAAVQKELGIEMSPSGILLPDGYAFWKSRDPERVKWHTPVEGENAFYSPKRLAAFAADPNLEHQEAFQHAFDALPPEAKTPEALDAMFSLRKGEAAEQPSAEAQPDLTLRNPSTGAEVAAQEAAPLKEMMGRIETRQNSAIDPLTKATMMVMGDRLGKLVGDTKVYTVGPEEMRALAGGRMKLQPGFEPAGFYDPEAGHIVVLDDALRDPAEAARLLAHEGLHAAYMDTINGSDAARTVIDHLRDMATIAHLDRGGDLADHYGLTNAHEFVSEAFSNSEFQRFLASIPADERTVAAFGLDRAPGNSLWDAFVGAVRRILGLAPDQHSLLDAAMRVGQLLDERRKATGRGAGDLAPMLRPLETDTPRTPEEDAARQRQFGDAKDAIAYRINGDRIAQHPNGPLAGYLGILTRDIHEKGGINVESVTQDYEGRMASHMEAIVEPYGSKMSGLKQDTTGIRDVVREIFGVDTGNDTAKIAGKAWGSLDKFATEEAKRLGKVFSPAEDWRVPQFWESRRAQKFGKRALLADMQAEIDRGGLKVFDPDTHEEANPLRQAEILNGAADKIVTDASLGGTPGASGSFRTDMRVFRFTDGAAGADAYLRLMDKYGAGQGGYLHMLEAHVGKVSRELGLARVLGPGWADTGEKLLQDALLADKTIKANRERPEGVVERLKALPGATGKFLMGWLESPAKAEAVWHYMSGQASGVGSELMAGLLSETRAFMTATRMGSALVTAVPADTVNWLMAARHNGMDMGRMVSSTTKAFLHDTPERREEAARLGITAHAGADAAIGTKRFGDQVVGEKLFSRMANFIIRSQGLHPWDSSIRRTFPMEFLGTIAQRAGKAFGDLDEPFGNFLKTYGFGEADWSELSKIEHSIDVGDAKFLHPDNLPEPLRVKLMSAIYDERQFAYLAGGSTRVKAISAQAKAGTLPGELARAVFVFKSFPMSMLATWGMRAARETGAGRIGTLATLVTGERGRCPGDAGAPYCKARTRAT